MKFSSVLYQNFRNNLICFYDFFAQASEVNTEYEDHASRIDLCPQGRHSLG
jgi:hypothetical protein